MIHPDTVLQFIDEEIGYGVFASKKIPRGTITWALDKFDIVFTPDEVAKMEPGYNKIIEKYTYRNRNGDFVLCWDFGRFVNHSFNSNCLSTGYEFEIAVRDIEKGEELTNDYGYLNLMVPFKARVENSSRTQVYPDDFLKYYPVWDELLKENFPFISKVEQPLLFLLSKEMIAEIEAVNAGQKQMRSILDNYYKAAKVRVRKI